MRFLSTSCVFTALSAGLLLATAAPVQAQSRLVAAGHGTYVSPNNQVETTFTFQLAERPDGSVKGIGIWSGPNATTVFAITSAMWLPAPYEGSLGVAGQIIAIHGTPNPSLFFTLGNTVFFAVNDNGGAGPDENSGISGWPPFFPPVTTIQEIVAFGQANNLYQITWRPLLRGNILVR